MNGFSQKLDLRQSQNLVMTPQLQQAIKLLQMNNQELAAFVEEELAQNPLLEKAETENEPAAEAAAPARDEMEQGFDEAWTGNEKAEEVAAVAPADFDAGVSPAGPGGSSSFEDSEFSAEATLTRPVTLREYLQEQIQLSFDDPRDRLIAGLLTDMLDESGYLRADPAELSARLGCPPARVESLMKSLKQFDPPGVFAGSLAECLALQLEDQGMLDAPMRALLDNLPLLAAHDHAALVKKCGVNETYLQDMIAEIKALNPRPASKFEHLVVQTVVPDAVMKTIPKSEGGGWRVELNSDTLPRVLVNQSYYTEVAGKARDKKSRDYLNEQLQSANWLIRAMDQRAKTILKVASEIVEIQEPFFLYGIEFLVPLTLRDIAQKIDMHESTVSRVTSNKYIGTPRGLFELKYFFSTALVAADGTAHSAEAVRARIKALIDGETAGAILSDDALVDLLKKEGIDIARRTVAKYREGLGIASSVQRRRLRKNEG